MLPRGLIESFRATTTSKGKRKLPTRLEGPIPNTSGLVAAEDESPPPGRGSWEFAVVLSAIPAAILLITALVRYLNGYASVDLALFDQGLWAASQGRLPYSSLIGETLLSDHFRPGFLLMALPYVLVPSAIWLIVGQVVAVWASVYLVMRRLRGRHPPWRIGILGAALMATPPVAYALLFDIHEIVFAVPFALAALFGWEKGDRTAATLFALTAASIRLEVGAAVLVGIALTRGDRRSKTLPLAVLAGYLAAGFALDTVLGKSDLWTAHFARLGDSLFDALLHPWRAIEVLVSGSVLARMLPWLVSGAFLALTKPRRVAPAAVLALPILLSEWPGAGVGINHYWAAPVLIAAYAWIERIQERPALLLPVVAANLSLVLLLGPFSVPLVHRFGVEGYVHEDVSHVATLLRSQDELGCVIEGIASDGAVSADHRATSLLAHRRHLYLWPFPFEGVDLRDLPLPHMSTADPERARKIDHIVVRRGVPEDLPDGFVLEAVSPHYVRYDRIDRDPEVRRCNPA